MQRTPLKVRDRSSTLNQTRSMYQTVRTNPSMFISPKRPLRSIMTWFCMHLETPPPSVSSQPRIWLRMATLTTFLLRQRPSKLRSPEETETREEENNQEKVLKALSDLSREQSFWSHSRSQLISKRIWRNSRRSRRRTRNISQKKKLREKRTRLSRLLNDRSPDMLLYTLVQRLSLSTHSQFSHLKF